MSDETRQVEDPDETFDETAAGRDDDPRESGNGGETPPETPGEDAEPDGDPDPAEDPSPSTGARGKGTAKPAGRTKKRSYEVYEVKSNGDLTLVGTVKAGEPTEARWTAVDKNADLKKRIYDDGVTVKLVATAPLTVTPTKVERVEKVIRK